MFTKEREAMSMPIEMKIDGRLVTLYDVEEAASYLELTVSSVNYHIYNSEYLKPIKIHNVRYLLESDLKKFKALDLKPGPIAKKPRRKKKQPSDNSKDSD